MDCKNRPCPAPHPRRGNSTAASERRNRPAFRPRSCRNHGSRAPDQQSRRHMRPRQPGGGLGLEPDGDDTERTARTNRKGPALGLGQHIAVGFVIIAVAAELPSAMRQRAVLNDEIRRGAGRHLDRKGRRRIVVRNIPIPDRLDEVGNSGGEPDAPRKTVGNDVLAATNGWLRLQLRKSDRLSGYHEKSCMLQQAGENPLSQAGRLIRSARYWMAKDHKSEGHGAGSTCYKYPHNELLGCSPFNASTRLLLLEFCLWRVPEADRHSVGGVHQADRDR